MSTAVFGAPEFKAASGRAVRQDAIGALHFDRGNGYLGPEQVFDAEEFFQAREDARRGRWRSPLHPDFVVYPADGDSAIVVDESDGMSVWLDRTAARDDDEDLYLVVGTEYFEAHSERKRPWAEAQFITWRNGAYLPQTAQRDTGYMSLGWRFGRDEGDVWLSEENLAQEIGDAEVTILIEDAS